MKSPSANKGVITIADGKIVIDTKINTKGAEEGTKGLKGMLEKTADKFKSIGTNMTKYVTAPIGALGGLAFAAADDIDKAYGLIQTGTGATGDALKGLKEDFDAVFENVPDSAEKVADALATLNTFTGASGTELQGLTENMLDASRSLGEDGASNAAAFGQALNQFGIDAKDGEKHLDNLFRISQDYGIGLGEVSGQLTNFGSVLINAGFDMEESAELMGRLNHSGLDVSRVMPGLNKAFRNWASEGKKPREELSKLIDELANAEEGTEGFTRAAEVFGADGVNRLKVGIDQGIFSLDELKGGLESSKGAVEDNNAATETFGEKMGTLKNKAAAGLAPVGDIMLELAEKAIPPVVSAIEKVSEWFQNLSPKGQNLTLIIAGVLAIMGPLVIVAGAVASAIAAISAPVLIVVGVITALIAIGVALWKNWDTIKEKAIEIWTALKDWFMDLFEKVKNIFSDALDWIDEKTNGKFKAITDVIRGAMETAEEIIKDVWKLIEDTIKNSLDFLKALFTGDFEEMKNIFSRQMENISDFAEEIWGKIEKFFDKTIENIVKFFEEKWTELKNKTETIFSDIKSFFGNIWSNIKETIITVITNIVNDIGEKWNSVKDTTETVFNEIKDFFSDTWDKITEGADKFKEGFLNIWESIKDGVKGIVNTVIGIANSLIRAIEDMVNSVAKSINGLPSFDIPDWVPGVGGGEFGLPKIDKVELPRIPALDEGKNYSIKIKDDKKPKKPKTSLLDLLKGKGEVVSPA